MDAILVAAMSINRVIGKNNKLPWHLPKDLEHFREITQGQVVVMGNNTFNSLKRKPFKKRTNVVLTHNINYKPDEEVYKVKSLDEIKSHFGYRKAIFIIGGESVYKLALKEMRVTKIYLTVIHEYFEGDTYFPEIDHTKFRCVKTEQHEENGLIFSFNEFDLVD